VLIVYLAFHVWPEYQRFHGWWHTPRAVGPFEVLRRQLAAIPGNKIVFFDTGYEGQHFEYVIRHDRTVSAATRRGSGWASGGDVLTDDYIRDTIAATAATTRCYYYYLERPAGPYAHTFVTELQRRGYTPGPPVSSLYRRTVPGFCRP
jgi:hypothetical protein